MNDIITIVDPGWDHRITLIMLIPGLILQGALVTFILSSTLRGRSRQYALREWAENLTFAGFVVTLIIGFTVLVWGGMNYSNEKTDRMVDALEDVGYSQVDLNLDEDPPILTASRNGDYFRGSLVPDGDLRWQVVELDG